MEKIFLKRLNLLGIMLEVEVEHRYSATELLRVSYSININCIYNGGSVFFVRVDPSFLFILHPH